MQCIFFKNEDFFFRLGTGTKKVPVPASTGQSLIRAKNTFLFMHKTRLN
jgi:hypothetical protein